MRQRHKTKVGTVETRHSKHLANEDWDQPLQKEILDLESAGFQLPQCAVISSRSLFGMEELPFDLSSFPTPASLDDYPKTRSCKTIHRNNNAPTTKQANKCVSSLTLEGHLHKVTMIPHP
jgi:hypothetical protein